MMLIMFICKIIVLILSINNVLVVKGWDVCGHDGICPEGTKCCPIPEQTVDQTFQLSTTTRTTTTTLAYCVPTAHSNLPYPEGHETGICCHDEYVRTGCPVGYECSATTANKKSHLRSTDSDTTFMESNIDDDKYYCRPTDKTKMEDPFAFDVPRYELCHVPSTMKTLHGFPIVSPVPSNDTSATNSTYHLPYYSSHGPIVSNDENGGKTDGVSNDHEKIEHAIIIIHGSLRDSDDYFCTGLSLLDGDDDDDDDGNNDETSDKNTLVIAPQFFNDNDIDDDNADTFLVWAEVVGAYDSYFWHIWRYGADAENAPVSSFTALDRMIESLVSPNNFPNLNKITLVGHSGKIFCIFR
jgi:hypothetical protein